MMVVSVCMVLWVCISVCVLMVFVMVNRKIIMVVLVYLLISIVLMMVIVIRKLMLNVSVCMVI